MNIETLDELFHVKSALIGKAAGWYTSVAPNARKKVSDEIAGAIPAIIATWEGRGEPTETDLQRVAMAVLSTPNYPADTLQFRLTQAAAAFAFLPGGISLFDWPYSFSAGKMNPEAHQEPEDPSPPPCVVCGSPSDYQIGSYVPFRVFPRFYCLNCVPAWVPAAHQRQETERAAAEARHREAEAAEGQHERKIERGF